jgi:hypothetical protein
MPTLIDSYPEANYNVSVDIGTGAANRIKVGQSFTAIAAVLNSAKFYLQKYGSPTGNVVACIYAHSGTYGTSSVPSGAALATSDNVDVSGLSTSLALVEFVFSGANKITLANATPYIVSVEYSAGDGSNFLYVGDDTATLAHGGNYCRYTGSWGAFPTNDAIFYVYGDDPGGGALLGGKLTSGGILQGRLVGKNA